MYQLSYKEPPQALKGRILAQVALLEARAARVRFFISSTVSLIALSTLVPTWNAVGFELSQTGFFEYGNLLASDSQSVLLHWQEFSLSLIDALPLASITLLLIVTLILLSAVGFASKYARVALSHHPQFA